MLSRVFRVRGRYWVAWLGLILGVGFGVPVRSADWEPDIRQFEEADRREGVGKVDALFYGSSSFRLWKQLPTAFPGIRVLNRGFGGCQLSDLVQYFDRVVLPHHPAVLLIYGGDNDIAQGESAEVVAQDFEALVRRVRETMPQTHVVFVAVKASPSREKFRAVQDDANSRVRRFARWHRRVHYLDSVAPLLAGDGRPDPGFFVSDRLHLNDEGYRRWQSIVDARLRRILGRSAG